MSIQDLSISVDTVWMLLAAMLVFFMQPGFAFCEAGFTRSKNTVNILFKNFVDFFIGSLLFWFVGFGMMFGSGGEGFVGMPNFGDLSFYHNSNGLPTEGFLMFETVFCATSATIVSGAMAERLNKTLEANPEPSTKEGKEKRKEERLQVRQLRQHADKLEEYDRKLETLGKRNSYSKTDKDATFMRMKEDAMMNGQTKPGYNLQIGTENQFILDFGLFQTPGDPLTMIPFLKSCHERYDRLPSTVVADSGYGSEKNYHFMDRAGIEAYVKCNRFHIEQRMHYEPDPSSQQALYYNADEDYYVCPMGQHMVRIGTSRERTESGYVAEKARYRAKGATDARCGADASGVRATGSSRSTTVLPNTESRPRKDLLRKKE